MHLKHWGIVTLAMLLSACSTYPALHSNSDNNELVVVIHGLTKSGRSMNTLSQGLIESGYNTCVLDYDTVGVTLNRMLQETDNQIEQCIDGAGKIHFVGHSLGGLVIRHYLGNHHQLQQQERLGRTVMLGTPNHGSDVADHYQDRFWANWFGEVPPALVSSENGLSQTLPTPDFEFGVIAGTKGYSITKSMFEQPNDGLVSVESTKLANMYDFKKVEVVHHKLKDDPQVISLVAYFLENGQFY
ncbi:alpha/beta fold hydrolase [Vibrio maerlii]|uniref:alpha/beta fold hydrolase n=1 Tax=Vibrio maerlii TaxID=2231648 RepID=UPI000E3D1CEB|nr:alpha/beta fold hydrolase [Vibrio maerlii]